MTTTNEGAVKQAANEAALEIDNDPELAQSLIPSLARQRKLAWIIIKHLSASVPQVTRVPVCMCGLDENPRLPRLDILCPKHDGQFPASVPEQAAGSAFDTKHGSFIEQSPRVCVNCEHSGEIINGYCTHIVKKERVHGLCGCKCEFPAT